MAPTGQIRRAVTEVQALRGDAFAENGMHECRQVIWPQRPS